MRILRKIKIDEISAVFRPASQHAKVLLMKSANADAPETGDIAVSEIRKMESDGRFDGYQKSDYLDLLNALAEDIQQEAESIQKAFTRGLETPAGRELFGLMKRAQGSEVVERGAKQDDVPKFDGPASAAIDKLAKERARITGRSYQQAYADILDDPGNRKLARAAADERELKMVRTLDIFDAQALTPTKPFPREARGN